MNIDITKYSYLKPFKGYLALKEIEQDKTKGLVKSGLQESRAVAYVVAINPEIKLGIQLGDVVIYNENEGQEAYKWGPIKEDGIILIHEDDIICRIDDAAN